MEVMIIRHPGAAAPRRQWRPHRRGGPERRFTAGNARVRATVGTFRLRPCATVSPAWRPWSVTLWCTRVSTLVLLVLLACSSAVVHAASDPAVEAIQRALVEKGFDPGTIDGRMGWRTRGAIRVFQRSVGLPDTGRTDTATMEALGLKPPGGGKTQADPDVPRSGTLRTEDVHEPSPEAIRAEAPDAEPTSKSDSDAPETESAPATTSHAAPTSEPGPGVPDSDSPGARLAPTPVSATPAAETLDTTPTSEPGAAALRTETPRPEPNPATDTATPAVETTGVGPTTEPFANTPESEALSAQPALRPAAQPEPGPQPKPSAEREPVATPKPAAKPTPAAQPKLSAEPKSVAKPNPAAQPEPVPEPKPAAKSKPVAKPKLSLAVLGWHRPQTGGEALERFAAIGAPRDFKRGTRSLFVPKSELVFVLKAGERIPGLDCDPGAGKLSIEFVFGPDGPVIFTPDSDGAYCQMGIGIAIAVGRTLDMRRVDWGDEQYPGGTVRVTNEGLEYVR